VVEMMKEREIEVGERKCEVGLVWKLRRRRKKNGVDKFSVESWRRRLLTFKVVFGSMERKNEFNISTWFFYNLGSGFKTCLPITIVYNWLN
jgi:hypothetical protein